MASDESLPGRATPGWAQPTIGAWTVDADAADFFSPGGFEDQQSALGSCARGAGGLAVGSARTGERVPKGCSLPFFWRWPLDGARFSSRSAFLGRQGEIDSIEFLLAGAVATSDRKLLYGTDKTIPVPRLQVIRVSQECQGLFQSIHRHHPNLEWGILPLLSFRTTGATAVGVPGFRELTYGSGFTS